MFYQRNIKIFLLSLLGLSTGSIFLFQTSPLQTHKKLYIVASTSIIADIAHNIVQDKANIYTIIKAPFDAHSHKLTLENLYKINGARLFILNGLHLEGSVADNLLNLRDSPHCKVICLSDPLPDESLLAHDPHIWFDVGLVIQATRYIANTIQEIDPKNKAYYEKNVLSYIQQLQKLQRYIQKKLEKVPKEKRIICMPHNAFHYFGKKYNYEILSLQGISTVNEPSIQGRTKIIDRIKKNKIQAIFLETSTNNKGMLAIQECCKQQGHPLTCHTIYTDSLDTAGEASTYIGMMRYNIDTICKALNPHSCFCCYFYRVFRKILLFLYR